VNAAALISLPLPTLWRGVTGGGDWDPRIILCDNLHFLLFEALFYENNFLALGISP
jgi:hypothetical protein